MAKVSLGIFPDFQQVPQLNLHFLWHDILVKGALIKDRLRWKRIYSYSTMRGVKMCSQCEHTLSNSSVSFSLHSQGDLVQTVNCPVQSIYIIMHVYTQGLRD